MIKEHKWFKIGVCFGAFMCFLLLCFTIYFSPNFVANNFSPDGILEPTTIFGINFIRLGFGVLSTTGLFFGALYLTKPDMFRQSYSNLDQIQILKLILFLLPVVVVYCAFLFKFTFSSWYRKIMWGEDSIVEYLTFIFYFLSFMISLSISISFYKSKHTLYFLMYMFLTLGLFFIAMEEISWGQRIFNASTPAFFMKYNYQKEIGFHNIKGVPLKGLYITVGLYGAFSRFILPKKVKIKYPSVVNLFVPDYYLFFYFFIASSYYFYFYAYVNWIAPNSFGIWFGAGKGHFLNIEDQELVELLLSCGFLLFVIINKCRQVGIRNFGSFAAKMKHWKNM